MNNRLFTLSDLYWSSVWLMTRIYHSAFSIPVLLWFARLRGRFKAFASQKKFLAKKNIVSIFGGAWTEKEVNDMVRRHFEYLEKFKLIKHLPYAKGFSNPARWPVEGLQNLESGLSQGKGVILVSAHFGYGRLIEYILEMKGYQIIVVRPGGNKMSKLERRRKKQIKNFTAFARFMYSRLQAPMRVAQNRELYAEFNMRPLVNALKQNDILFIVADGMIAMKFVELDFLGHPLPFPTGFVSIALATGAAVLPIFAVDSAEGFGIKIIIEKPLTLKKTPTPAQDSTVNNVEKFARIVESYVRRYPHLYGMLTDERGVERKLARSRREVAERYLSGGN